MEESVITMQDIFVFNQTGMSENSVLGVHVSTGIRPEFLKKIERAGIEINGKIFDAGYKHSYMIKTNNENLIQAKKTPIKPKLDTRQIDSVRESIKSQNESDIDILRRLNKNGRRNINL